MVILQFFFFFNRSHRKKYANLNFFLMPSLISTECSRHSWGSRRSNISRLFLNSETLRPVQPATCYSFLDGKAAIEFIWLLKACLKFNDFLQLPEFLLPFVSLAVLRLPIALVNLLFPTVQMPIAISKYTGLWCGGSCINLPLFLDHVLRMEPA